MRAIPASKNHPSKIFVEATTRCNLRCDMCVKQSAGGYVAEGDFSRKHFAALEDALPLAETLVLSGIGEPLLNGDLEYFISRAKRLMPPTGWAGFQTNGFLLDGRRAESLLAAGVDRVCVSVDGSSEETYGAVRGCGDPGVPERALSALTRAADAMGRKDFRAGIEFVAMRGNIGELPAVLEWAASLGVRFAIVSQLLPYEKSMAELTAYDTSTDAALSFFEKWKLKARESGIDMSRYFSVYVKYIRDEEEERIFRFVNDMVADAAANGVSLHVAGLLGRDDSLTERARAVFDEAKRIADSHGIEITLPEIIPRSVRRCDFVEEGSAFVSWDGSVHPCHFLWHRFRCYLGGVENNVKPFIFGSLEANGLLDIWNGPAFRSFRENVLRYDFPFCYDCNFALCDLVQDEDFIHDCYVSAVPCAACLWCTQLFQCMR